MKQRVIANKKAEMKDYREIAKALSPSMFHLIRRVCNRSGESLVESLLQVLAWRRSYSKTVPRRRDQ